MLVPIERPYTNTNPNLNRRYLNGTPLRNTGYGTPGYDKVRVRNVFHPKEVSLFQVPPCGTHCRRPCVTVTDTDSVLCPLEDRVVFCEPDETLPQRLGDSLGCKDYCANTNALTYLLDALPFFGHS